jgi:stearoyl-CoA 9-desaturase NADPH oxidoreductase
MVSPAAWPLDTLPSMFNGLTSRLWSRVTRRALPLIDRASLRVTADLPLLESALAKLDPTLSLRTVRARVVSVIDETHDVKTYVLRPNARFGTYRPGSYVTLRLPIDGRVVQRSYSLSSAPTAGRTDGLIAITVKRVPGGHVSNWLADTLRPGYVLELSAPQGQFVLPATLPTRMLMLSAGSGITPVMSMLRQLVAAAAPERELVFLHFARSPRDLIFRRELEALAARTPNLRLVFCVEEADASWSDARGRFSQALLEQVAPDFREMHTFLCGPSAFMQNVMQTYERAEADLSRLRYERFNVEFDASTFLEHTQIVRFARSGGQSISNRPRTILEEAEGMGVPIESGCRAGNCGTCRCRKISGVVVDITTGLASSADEGFIYPCVSVARGTVEIDL